LAVAASAIGSALLDWKVAITFRVISSSTPDWSDSFRNTGTAMLLMWSGMEFLTV
jgi:hypothetical protein